MQSVMVHIDSDLGPIGAWSFHHGGLTHFYPESLDLAISGRARQLMAGRRGEAVPDWFLYMSTVEADTDVFHTLDVADGTSLVDVITEYRRVWNTTV